MLITYDEHGGFYDHVATPVEGVPNPDGIVGPHPYYFRFDRLGVRVPTFIISPWIDKGTGMCSKVFSFFRLCWLTEIRDDLGFVWFVLFL